MATLNILLNRGKRLQIDTLICEVSDRETHEFVNEISEYTVEDGYSVTDNVFQKSSPFTTHLIFTCDPFAGGNQKGRDKIVFDKLLELGGFAITKNIGAEPVRVSEPQKIDIISELHTYVNMYIQRIFVNRVPTNAGALDVEVTFKPVRIRKNEFTDIRIVKDVKAGKNMKQKIQNNSPVGEKPGRTKDQSFIKGLYDNHNLRTQLLSPGLGAI